MLAIGDGFVLPRLPNKLQMSSLQKGTVFPEPRLELSLSVIAPINIQEPRWLSRRTKNCEQLPETRCAGHVGRGVRVSVTQRQGTR